MFEIERFEHCGRTVVIVQDEDAGDPRKEFDNLAVMACWHRRVRLGDRQIVPTTEEDLRADGETNGDPILAVLPLYLYEHSGMTVECAPFGCRFDSGQVGWAYVTKSTLDRTDWALEERSEEALHELIRSEVRVYDRYLRGAVLGYRILGIDGEEIHSCWGFYDEIDYVREEAKSAAEGSEDPAIIEEAAELAARATYAGGSP